MESNVMSFDEVLEVNGVECAQEMAWGRSVGLMSITAGEVLEWLEQKGSPEKAGDAALLMLARSMVSDDKTRLAGTPEREQQMVAALKLKDSRTVNRLVERIMLLNGIKVMTAAGAAAEPMAEIKKG